MMIQITYSWQLSVLERMTRLDRFLPSWCDALLLISIYTVIVVSNAIQSNDVVASSFIGIRRCFFLGLFAFLLFSKEGGIVTPFCVHPHIKMTTKFKFIDDTAKFKYWMQHKQQTPYLQCNINNIQCNIEQGTGQHQTVFTLYWPFQLNFHHYPSINRNGDQSSLVQYITPRTVLGL